MDIHHLNDSAGVLYKEYYNNKNDIKIPKQAITSEKSESHRS